ncbi:CDP-alcohol phosphatidyltransferase family protein [Paracoccus sediminicola]|uniref:CDP-alcohol phosphatidyltransferase family protein n=1 Tax=Paracoccus sediminicola TaxID=3017783 RepID=UPI0022F08DA1|nr:CDP-alcohol phosphatidyltransferase family protein [Paracoccus sediminicola]WBU56547.1 CDP-alcohol phosphatidyltransferase family protein [Paracoccus sediminicola]
MSEIGGEARLRGAMRGRRQDHLQAGLFGAGLAGCAALLICCAALRPIGVSGWVLPVIGFVLLWLLIRGLMVRHYPLHRVGPANTLTMIRAAMILSLTSPLLSGMAAGWTVAAIASVALALDGIDGWLARRSGLASSFGARFDLEIDALLALLLAVHGYLGSAAGAPVLALGLVRYLFAAASMVWPWLTAPLPQRWRRKAICVAQLATLILLQLPALPGPLADGLSWAALGLVLWSFAADILWLRARR